jgi:hypothetical protein
LIEHFSRIEKAKKEREEKDKRLSNFLSISNTEDGAKKTQPATSGPGYADRGAKSCNKTVKYSTPCKPNGKTGYNSIPKLEWETIKKLRSD